MTASNTRKGPTSPARPRSVPPCLGSVHRPVIVSPPATLLMAVSASVSTSQARLIIGLPLGPRGENCQTYSTFRALLVSLKPTTTSAEVAFSRRCAFLKTSRPFTRPLSLFLFYTRPLATSTSLASIFATKTMKGGNQLATSSLVRLLPLMRPSPRETSAFGLTAADTTSSLT